MTTIITGTTLTSGYQLSADSTGTLAIQTGSGPTTAMYIDSSQRVGIGTTSPSLTLNVKSPSDYRTALFETTSTLGPSVQIKGSRIYELRSTDTGASEGSGLFFIYDKTAELSRVTIDTSGNVGIGISSSIGAKLEVKGGATDNATININNNNGNIWKLWNDNGANGLNIQYNGTTRLLVTAAGTLSITQVAGTNTIDVSGNATSIANGGTVAFPNASGMLVVNNHTNGNITIFLGGGGATSVVSSVGVQVGTFTYTSGNAGYTWTSNYGSIATYAFYFLKTRPTA